MKKNMFIAISGPLPGAGQPAVPGEVAPTGPAISPKVHNKPQLLPNTAGVVSELLSEVVVVGAGRRGRAQSSACVRDNSLCPATQQ